MPKINQYNLYDNGILILKNVQKKDMDSYLGFKLPGSLAEYIRNGHKIKGRYTVTYFNSEQEPPSLQEQKFIEEWNKAVSRFKNVIWVKTGGRRLSVSKL